MKLLTVRQKGAVSWHLTMNIVSCAVVLFFSIGLGLAVKTMLIMSEVSYRARTVGKVYGYNGGITINW